MKKSFSILALLGALFISFVSFTGCDKDDGTMEPLTFTALAAHASAPEGEVTKVLAFEANPANSVSLQSISIAMENIGSGNNRLEYYADDIMLYVGGTRVGSINPENMELEGSDTYLTTFGLAGIPITKSTEIAVHIRASGDITEDNAALNTFQVKTYDISYQVDVNETTIRKEWTGNTATFKFTEK